MDLLFVASLYALMAFSQKCGPEIIQFLHGTTAMKLATRAQVAVSPDAPMNILCDAYEEAHFDVASDILHTGGMFAALALFLLSLINKGKNWRLLLYVPPCYYLPAWLGHFMIQRDIPAVFSYGMTWRGLLSGEYCAWVALLRGRSLSSFTEFAQAGGFGVLLLALIRQSSQTNKRRSRSVILPVGVLVVLVCLLLGTPVKGFAQTSRRCSSSSKTTATSRLVRVRQHYRYYAVGGTDDLDGIGDAFDEGKQDLSKQFYDQIGKNETARARDTRVDNAELFSKRQEMSSRNSGGAVKEGDAPNKKFTGASLFSQDQLRTPELDANMREYEREFNLAGRFENLLGIQAAILLASLIFVISVGLSGGITDGSDRSFGGADEIDESYNPDYWSQLQDGGRVDLESVGKASDGSVFL